jgi:DNA processing protein
MYKNIFLHLSLISGIGPATIKTIIEKLVEHDFEKLYDFKITDFIDRGLTYDRATKIVAGLQDRSLLEKELELIARYNINWCVLGSNEYSQLLAEIEQPPVVIYYQGTNLFPSDKAIAFVGSRKADAYARIVVEKLVPPLVGQDWVVVSGGALGVDSFVHDQVTKLGGKTIVVLGSGLLNWYPASNSGLFNRVIQAGGMIVSCFSLQTQPIAANFPARNRIIAGLSQGTVVVQAARKSGALITADFALEQGRQVFAVPGSIEHGLHDGCHYLIQQGAKLVSDVADITTEFGYDATVSMVQDVQIQLPLSTESINCADSQDKAILQYLLQARSAEDLLRNLDISLEDLMQKLFDLSLEGKIEQDMMGLYKRI